MIVLQRLFQPLLLITGRHSHHVLHAMDGKTKNGPRPTQGKALTQSPDAAHAQLSSLPLPPRQQRIFGRLLDSLEHFQDPDEFIGKRTAELGPIFMASAFFKPVVFVGGTSAVRELAFKMKKVKLDNLELPEPFRALLQQNGENGKDLNPIARAGVRKAFSEIFSKKKLLDCYTPTIAQLADTFIDSLVEHNTQEDGSVSFFLRPALNNWSLELGSILFTGQGLSNSHIQLLHDFNAGFFAPTKHSKTFQKAQKAQKELIQLIYNRFLVFIPDSVEPFLPPAKDRSSDFALTSAARSALMVIWAMGGNAAVLLMHSLILLTDRSNNISLDRIRAEYASVREGRSSWSDMPYTNGLVKEAMRVHAPAGGNFWSSDEEIEIGGYRIPPRTPITIDPRIGNFDETIFPDPQVVAPQRWMEPTAASSNCPFRGTALGKGVGSWIPGGVGPRKCPGIGLAELVAMIFLAKMTDRFASFEFSGSGLTKEGGVRYNYIGSKAPTSDLSLRLTKY